LLGLFFFVGGVIGVFDLLADALLFEEFLIVLLSRHVQARVEPKELLPSDVHLIKLCM
jgi:hypothetical protein